MKQTPKKQIGRASASKTGPARIHTALTTSETDQLLVIGRNGTAKVELMKFLALQEIKRAKRSVVVLDTIGDLSEMLIAELSTRKRDMDNVLVIDPIRNGTQPFGFFKFNSESDAAIKSEAIVDAFRVIYQNQFNALDLKDTQGWSNYTDKILQNSLLLLMYTQKNLHDLPVLLSDNDFRDILLDKLSMRQELRVDFRTSLLNEWHSYKRLSRTDRWLEWIEPILHCVKLLLRQELSFMFDLNVPWIENPLTDKNAGSINISNNRPRIAKSANDILPPQKHEAARDSNKVPAIVHYAIMASSIFDSIQTKGQSEGEEQGNRRDWNQNDESQVLDLEKLIESEKAVIINLSLRDLHLDTNPLAESVAALFLASLIGSSRNLWSAKDPQSSGCAIFTNSLENIASTKTLHRICRDGEKYNVSLRLCSNSLPVKNQAAVDRLIDDMGNVAVFAIPRADAELLGSEMFRCSGPETDKIWQLMKQDSRSYCFYQARTGEIIESMI